MEKLFGTDGVRGKAGEFPLDAATMYVIGASLATRFAEICGRSPRFVSGRDTRESGGWIEQTIHAGAASAGAEIISAGVITTPGVAFLTQRESFDAGIVISASHNPYQDNGIKVFLPSGKKIDDKFERLIEMDVAAAGGAVFDGGFEVDASRAEEFCGHYLEHLTAKADRLSLAGKKIVVDCANGASSFLAPRLFSALGADIIAIHCEPDGRNINENCGSTHIKDLQGRVVAEGADLGIAFDGDADRSLFVNEHGEIVDGDATLWILARYLKAHGRLVNGNVVATVMSNIGLELALESRNIKLLRADVGDKYVLEKLIETKSEIGGEQSGHIIFPEMSLVGDGMMTALMLLSAIKETGEKLSAATDGFTQYPQTLVNVKVREKLPFNDVSEIAAASDELTRELDGNGRLLLRYSGTENLARVMIEGKDQATIERQAKALADVIRTSLG